MTGWFVRDAAGRVWTLTSMGTIGAGESKSILRNGMPMGLNNGSETVVLIDPEGVERDVVEYEGAVEGEWVETEF